MKYSLPFLLLAIVALFAFEKTSAVHAQVSTEDHLSSTHFWPTQTRYPRSEYAGSAACAGCHSKIFADQQQTSMAQAAMRVAGSEIFRANPDLAFDPGFAHFGIRTDGGKSLYTASMGASSESAELTWAFGAHGKDAIGQSFLFRAKNGDFREARVTFFIAQSKLDFTPSRQIQSATSVDEAFGRVVPRAEVIRCFACHTTMSGGNNSFDETKLVPGIQCEACHGPGAGHVAEMKGHPPAKNGARSVAGSYNRAGVGSAIPESEITPYRIFNPKRLTPEERVDFCGSCHGSYWDVSLSGSGGVGNARFQPYRLQQSKCWNENDARLTCTACHDPHQEVNKNAASYDHVCLSCHVLKGSAANAAVQAVRQESGQAVGQEVKDHPGAACPRAVSNCTTCHMQQVDVPGMHSSFPDHRIRIVREGEVFPD